MSVGGLATGIVALAGLMYLGGVIWAGLVSVRKGGDPSTIPAFVTQSVTAIGGALATNFGALMGVSVTTPDGGAATSALADAAARLTQTAAATQFQVAAAYLYFATLVVALGFWAITKFAATAADIIKNMSSTLIGVAAAVLAIVLSH